MLSFLFLLDFFAVFAASLVARRLRDVTVADVSADEDDTDSSCFRLFRCRVLYLCKVVEVSGDAGNEASGG